MANDNDTHRPPAPEAWHLWLDGAHDPAFNMAADDVLLATAASRGRPLLRVYGWDRLAVSIGYIQRRDAAPAGYAVVRRPTGGGVVYHDYDYTYTVVLPPEHWLAGLDRVTSYDWINRSVQAGLTDLAVSAELAEQVIPHNIDRLSMICFKNPTKFDILVGDRKIAGSAQRRTHDGILHQGSIHFGGPLPYERAAMTQALIRGFASIMAVTMLDYHPADEFFAAVARCRAEKYATDEWNGRR
ncbi:lipoate--protein ligase family protein [Oligosphaera ethanolica]|uniref:Lipoate-protein ligase A n=1 Tax=Oligosphaera ethanolica TaxID=760260 RepID=A0AAE4ALQ5_9BACT|nr:biotin/lipoate A/B protein ligase family protein [Oligosphaera ethanolica]MDQ0288519.1 lipoate-protein ligase A [Oligosphaera ethanolica]